MKELWIALGIVGTIPLLAAAQAPDQTYQQPSRSVIKPAGFSLFSHGGCTSCAEPAPTCCTPMPPPSIGRCCPKPCLLEKVRRGLRALDCLLPCRLGCHTSCSTHCKPGGCGGCGCSASCEANSSCPSCCTQSRAHFFAFCKPKCCKPSCSSCCSPVPTCCTPNCAAPTCSCGVPATLDIGPPPMPDSNPFQDDKPMVDPRPMVDPNTPPPGRDTYYKPYWKKNGATAAAPGTSRKESAQPTPATVPVKLDPYAVAPPVHIQARPIQPAAKVAIRQAEPAREFPAMKVAATEEIETVSLNINDEPPAPPMILPAASTAKRIEIGGPVNPLR